MINKCKHLLLILAALFAATSGQAQNKAVEAYIVTAADDTIQGFLKMKNEKQRLRNIRFKPIGETAFSSYSPSQIKAYGVGDSVLYIAREIKGEEQPAFLKVLVNGPTRLYAAPSLNSAGDFYVQRPGEQVALLQKRNNLAELNYFLSDCSYSESGSRSNQKNKYKSDYLTSTIQAYNACRHPDEVSEILYRPIKINYLFGLSMGGHMGSTSYKGTDVFGEKNLHENVPVTPGVAGAIFMNISDESSYFMLQAELLYKSYKNSQTLQERRYTRSFDFQTAYLQMPLLLQFKLPQLLKIQPYVSAGLSFGYLVTPEIVHEIDYYEQYSRYSRTVTEGVRNRTTGFVAGGGFYYKLTARNRLVLDVRYSQETSPTTNNFRTLHLSGLQITTGITL